MKERHDLNARNQPWHHNRSPARPLPEPTHPRKKEKMPQTNIFVARVLVVVVVDGGNDDKRRFQNIRVDERWP